MKIKTKDKHSPEILEVYAMYEVSGDIYYYVRPHKYEGLLVMRNDEIEVIDNSITNFVFKHSEYGFLICSKLIEDDDFRESLSECDPDAFAKFSKLIAIKNEQPLKCCRVCGLEYSDYYPWGEDGKNATYDKCVCCGCQFGYDDDESCDTSISAYRTDWFNNGAPLSDPESKYLPKQWTLANLKLQLLNIGLELTDEIIAEIDQSRNT